MKNLQKEYGLYINGKWQPASDGATFKTYSPATGEELAVCAEATREDVDAAVKAAHAAWESWKNTTPVERAVILNKIADIIDANAQHLAEVESLDNGKPIRETSMIDIPMSADHFRYFAAAIRTEEGTATMLDNNTLSLVLHEPIGVVGQIIPWNFPFLMAAWKLAPALAAGDCIVLKPSSTTSLSVLELGGKSANIYFDDCNWDLAMEGLLLGILFNQGQVCCAGSRVFVHEKIYDKFVEEAVKRFNAVKVGNPLDPATQMGSQIDAKQVAKIASYIDIAKAEGAAIACGGHKLTENGLDKGNFFAPTLITNVTNDMRVAREEIFGPVAVVIKFKDEAEVVKMANDSNYGLGGAVWTQDINRAIRVAKAVQTGRMWVNTYNAIPAGAPFGGYKESGIGRETHKVMLEYYSQTKNIMINLGEKPLGLY